MIVFGNQQTMREGLELFMQGMDPYDYVGGNPESRTDPTGNAFIGNKDERAWISGGKLYETVPWSPAPPTVIGTWNSGVYRPVVHPAFPPPPPMPKPRPAAPPPPPPDPIVSWATNAGHLLWSGVDMFLGISSMVNDVGTLTSSDTSGWDKLWAAADLAMNLTMEMSMVAGFGEEARIAELAAKGGEELLAHAAEDAAAHGAEDIAEHGAEDIAEHACSFTFDTPVATATGEQAIGTLKAGEKVWAYNPTTKKMELEPIKHVWINHDDDLVDLAIAYTTKDKQGHPVQQIDTVHTNKKHPFLTQEKGFVEVAHLDVSLHLIRADGSVGTLVAWNVVAGTSTMYNLEVAQDHTFTVSDGLGVVHNCGFENDTLKENHFQKHIWHHLGMERILYLD
ncbi:polymorphic toxin-type HINT domain-containing protein [Ktedonospora formicarum]|uniref:Intein C-terminal splicing domain-containing protein n=1 Tax=Ktedonospora formicarum TaxID=2778364 RepID=A0A8J3MXJ5_9CHLR|nr:polymorphic toxin-type HINT domain-containing protein [Ktedonospora formicarum]GHO48635.1 hypothetical protein KSX_67980 [Ktedonospora formicarum]